jgi:hypothetical protein
LFTKDMIAPCGLDCSICKRALAETHPCAGCRGPSDNKPEFCSVRCGIILCEKRKSNGYHFNCWALKENAREFARVVIKSDQQHKGLSVSG